MQFHGRILGRGPKVGGGGGGGGGLRALKIGRVLFLVTASISPSVKAACHFSICLQRVDTPVAACTYMYSVAAY